MSQFPAYTRREILLSAGAALRLHGIVELPLIEDAFYTLRDAAQLTDKIRTRPLYFLLQNGVFQFLPVNHLSLRLLPLLFGLLGIFAIWAAGNRLFGPPRGPVGGSEEVGGESVEPGAGARRRGGDQHIRC